MQSLLHSLRFHTPLFRLNTAQIEILRDPVDFYVALHKGVRAATSRIVWSSLYIGTGHMEHFLVESLSQQLRKYEQLRLSILLDYYRATRLNAAGEAAVNWLNQLRMTNLCAHQMKLGLLRHPLLPELADKLENTPAREIFNVHHMKWYIFDDKVIISGGTTFRYLANLEEQYFTTRQDRYFVFHEAPEVADYLDDAHSALMQHAYQIDLHQQCAIDPTRARPTQRRKYFGEFNQTWKLFKFSYKDASDLDTAQSEEAPATQQPREAQEEQEGAVKSEDDEAEIERRRNEALEYFEKNLALEEKMQERKKLAVDILHKAFDKGAVSNIVQRLEKTLYRHERQNLDEGEDAFVAITLHIPFLQTDEDQLVFQQILKLLDSDQTENVYWASGYMNFPQSVVRSINAARAAVKLLTASPQANGFYKAGKYKHYIPIFYRIFEQQFTQPLYEYARPGWTFHAKGFWAELKDNSSVTVIGSSNYAERSFNRDTEVQFYILTACPMFRQELEKERQNLFAHSHLVSPSHIQNDPDLKITFKARLLARFFKGYL